MSEFFAAFINSVLEDGYVWVVLTFVVFFIADNIYQKTKNDFISALFITYIVISGLFLFIDVDYEKYTRNMSVFTSFLGPATTALAIPLYRNYQILKENFAGIMAGIFAGSFMSLVFTFAMAKVFVINHEIFISLMPKNVTLAMGLGMLEIYGGMSAILVVGVAMSGNVGMMIVPWLCKVFKITHPVAQGVAFGTSAHAMGTTKAIQMGDVQGAISGLAIGICGVMTVIMLPAFAALY